MTTRAEHYGIVTDPTKTFKPSESREFHRRFTIAMADMRRDKGFFTTEDFYGERNRDGSAKSNGWIWQQCTGIERDPDSVEL